MEEECFSSRTRVWIIFVKGVECFNCPLGIPWLFGLGKKLWVKHIRLEGQGWIESGLWIISLQSEG